MRGKLPPIKLVPLHGRKAWILGLRRGRGFRRGVGEGVTRHLGWLQGMCRWRARWPRREQGGGQVGTRLDAEHPTERAKYFARLGRGGHQRPDLGIAGQHLPEIRSVAGRVIAREFDYPAETPRHTGFLRGCLGVCGPCRSGPARIRTQCAGLVAGGQGGEPSQNAAEVGREQHRQRRHRPVPRRAGGGGPAQAVKHLGQTLREGGGSQRRRQRRPGDGNVLHTRI